MNTRIFLILFSFSAITGCSTQTVAQLRTMDQNFCHTAGYKPKTTAFKKCLGQRDLQRDIDKRLWQNDRDVEEGLPLPYPWF